jgi:hypothetical protein
MFIVFLGHDVKDHAIRRDKIVRMYEAMTDLTAPRRMKALHVVFEEGGRLYTLVTANSMCYVIDAISKSSDRQPYIAERNKVLLNGFVAYRKQQRAAAKAAQEKAT